MRVLLLLLALIAVPQRKAPAVTSAVPLNGNPAAEYPADGGREETTVSATLEVGDDGTVRGISKLRVVPENKQFEAPATATFLKWRFKPATKDGKPVPGTFLAALRFTPPGPFRLAISSSTSDRITVRPDSFSVAAGKDWIPAPAFYTDLLAMGEFRLRGPTIAGFVFRDDREHSSPRYMVTLGCGKSPCRVGEVTGNPRAAGVYDESAARVVAASTDWIPFSIDVRRDNVVVTFGGSTLFSSTGLREYAGYVGFDVKTGVLELRNVSLTRTDSLYSPAPLDVTAIAESTPGLVEPKLVHEVRPWYTRAAMARQVEGGTVLDAIVEVDGRIGDIRIRQSLDPDLDYQGIDAVLKWRFKPATLNGGAIRALIAIELTFSVRR